jgi:Xaa-Pro aminopeptidase
MKAFDASFFTENRQRVIEKLSGSLLVVPAYTQMQRSNDAAFKFEQEAHFWYTTGIEHPDWWLIIDGTRARCWLVAPLVDEVHALFDGSLSHEDAAKISGISDILDRREGLELLKQAARKHQFVYMIDAPSHHDHFGFTINPSARELREVLARCFAKVQDFRPKLAELRAIKQPQEVEAIQSAIDLTIRGFRDIRTNLSVYKYEYEIEADFSQLFRRTGAGGHAYDPIVASGANACTLHYGDNQSKLTKQSLLLMDIGARSNGYAADITRTYAVGTPTKRQQAVHGAVERAQQRIIASLAPGITIASYQKIVDEYMIEELVGLGLMKDTNDTDAYRQYFPHAISHGLGIDVHDSLGKPKTLQPGMVLTVEPGIYIPEESIGVRIEDDILITETGHRNLSAKLSTAL